MAVDVKVVVAKSWESESQSSERLGDRVDNSCTNNLIRNTSLVYQQLCLHQHGAVGRKNPEIIGSTRSDILNQREIPLGNKVIQVTFNFLKNNVSYR